MFGRTFSRTSGNTLTGKFMGYNALHFSDVTQICSKHDIHVGREFCKLICGQKIRMFRNCVHEKSTVVLSRVSKQFSILSNLFVLQCNALAAQRIRRGSQIAVLYRGLGYDKDSLVQIARQLRNTVLQHKEKPFGFLFGATALFSWEKKRITDKDLAQMTDEINFIKRDDSGKVRTNLSNDWEIVIEKKHVTAWRKPVPNTYLYEYKMFGTFTDIPARAFYNAQIDMKYRRKWDKLIIKIDVVDRDQDTSAEVVQWIMHFPYPMYSREYVFVRKRMVDQKGKLMALMSQATEHPACPRQDDKYVRVESYMSHMVIKPHKSFDENGFDFILTYHDDPKSAFPKIAYNWMASTGVPDFVEQMHQAARTIHEWKQQGKWSYDQEEDHTSPEGEEPM